MRARVKDRPHRLGICAAGAAEPFVRFTIAVQCVVLPTVTEWKCQINVNSEILFFDICMLPLMAHGNEL